MLISWLAGRLNSTAVDVVFFRYRPSGQRRLGFKEFIEALAAVAYEAGLTFEDVMIALGCRGQQPLTPDGSAVRINGLYCSYGAGGCQQLYHAASYLDQ